MLVKYSAAGVPQQANISQFVGNDDSRVGDVVFRINDPSVTDADIWIVSEAPERHDLHCTAKRVVFVAAETMWTEGRESESASRKRFLSQFDTVYTYQDLYWPSVRFAPPFLPWMINANHGPSIFSPHPRGLDFLSRYSGDEKVADLSVICSTKTYTPGHRVRLRFVEALASEFGDQMAWFGNGRERIDEKWDAIAPFRFHLAIENQSSYGVFTEKLYDAFLGLSHPLYFGAPDISRYFPERSLTLLNIHDFRGSVATIRETVAAGIDQDARNALIAARDSVLGEWNLFNRLARLAERESLEQPRRGPTRLTLPPRDVARWRSAVSAGVRRARMIGGVRD